MDQEPDPDTARRETILTVVLAGLAAGGILLFLTLVTGGLLGYMVLVALGVAFLGYLNYLLWGRSLSEEVERQREQEEAERRDPPEQGQWPVPDWRDERRI